MASDLLSTVRSELDARLDELRPLLSEYERLLAAVDALGAGDDGTAPPPAAERTLSATQRSRARHGRRSPSTGAIKPAASGSNPRGTGSRKRARAPRGAAQHTILAALEHGSHTTSELVSVTALGAPNIRSNLRRAATPGDDHEDRAVREDRLRACLELRRGVSGPCSSGELVAKHHDLELLELRAARAQRDELDQPAKHEVEKRGEQVRSPSVKDRGPRPYGGGGGRPCPRPRHKRVCAPHTLLGCPD